MSENTNNQDLALIIENDKEQFLSVIDNNYPTEIKEGINQVVDILTQEKQITDLYPEILAEIPISTSQFQDTCVQYGQHFTPHKKLRQAVMELQDKLGALYAAKTSHKKAMLKVERTKLEIENLEEELDLAVKENDDKSSKRLKLSLLEKQVELEENERGLNSSSHLVKDAMLKVIQQENLVDKYKKEVEESGLSYEESEVEYYVMYFTYDAEKQLRTMGRIDTGTFGAIGQLPEEIRKKVLNNISFLKHKLFEENYPAEGDFLCKVFFEELRPKKTGENEMEGMKVDKFIGSKTIKLLSLNGEDSNK